VARIVPVLSQRSVVRLDDSQAAAKQAHWRAVMVSACEQCGRNRLPTIDAPQPLLNYLGGLAAAAPLDSASLRLVLEPALAPPLDARPPVSAAQIAIGPEGGFASEELDAFELCGFVKVALGPRILRTETAAIAAVVMLQSRFGDMSAAADAASRTDDS